MKEYRIFIIVEILQWLEDNGFMDLNTLSQSELAEKIEEEVDF